VKRAVLLHYHEINLKGNNRGWFENRLHQHITRLLRDLEHEGTQRFGARMCIGLKDEIALEEIVRRLRCVFGLANFACTWEMPAELETIRNGIARLLAGRTFGSFRIDARRGTKDFPLNSQQLNQQLGQFVQHLSGAAVRLENPDLVVYVELVGKRCFVYFDKIAGAGGLPSGTGGRVMCLISGGLDSPVAAYRMMRRGCQALFVHFHSFPHTTAESQDKVRQLLRVLARYQLDSGLFLVPFAEIQREIVAFAPPSMRVILYRRFMMRIAEALALREKALALVTGDSLGQVASQTLQNMRTISDVANLPIFRPLVGEDKEDIMKAGREIGTYEISIQPDQDCCTMFIPRHPETMAAIEAAEKAEAVLDVPRLLESALASTSKEVIQPDFAQSSENPAVADASAAEIAGLERLSVQESSEK
jgi:thiamine biosynthesis protein ThiI